MMQWHDIPSLLARGPAIVAVTALVAAGSGAAASSDHRPAPAPAGTAVLADASVGADRIARAVAALHAGAPVVVVRCDGPYAAQAQAAALAAGDYATIVAVGPDAWTAAGLARGAEAGAGVHWSRR